MDTAQAVDTAHRGLPPGPSGRLATTFRFARSPLAALDEWRTRYGDPFTIKAVNGDVVTTGRPELIKSIFSFSPDELAPFAVHAILPLAGEHSIFANQGAAHTRQRRLLMPPFHGDRMRTYNEIFAEATRRQVATAEGPTKMLPLAQRISLEVISRAVFGVATEALEEVERAVRRLVRAANPLLLFFPALQVELAGWGPMATLRRAREHIDALLQARIDAARQVQGGQDILSLLVATRDDTGRPLDEQEIKDHLRTLLFAGHETTAIVLAWAVDQLGRHPEVLDALRNEIDADAEPRWLPAVVYETLRLYPPASEVLRVLRTPMTLDEWTLPVGAVVSPSIHLLHRDPAIYPNPDRFQPQRFLDIKPRSEHFLPFGGGHRRCIGAAFATRELMIMVRTLVAEFDFMLLNDRPPRVVRRNVTLAPSDDVPVRFQPRR